MSGNKKGVRERLAAAAGKNLPEGTGSYSISSAAAAQIKRKLYGSWVVTEHRLGDAPYIDRFVERNLRELAVEEVEYRAEYIFKDGISIKHVEISGQVPTAEGSAPYLYRLSMASVWEPAGSAQLGIRPELGYQRTELDGTVVAFKELGGFASQVLTGFRFEGDVLILEEEDDYKRLERLE